MNIIDYIPYGQKNAIGRRELATACGLPDRVMRKRIELARAKVPILSLQDGSGYFRPTTEEKPLVERWMKQERSRSKSIGNATLGAEKFLTGSTDGKMVSVHGYMRRKRKDDEPIRQVEGQLVL